MSGDDFNKCQLSFRLAWPEELEPILRWWINNRSAGPLLLRRTIVEGHLLPALRAESQRDINRLFEEKLATAMPYTVQSRQDRK